MVQVNCYDLLEDFERFQGTVDVSLKTWRSGEWTMNCCKSAHRWGQPGPPLLQVLTGSDIPRVA